MRLQIFSESERDAVHPAFDEIIADVLQDRSEQPAEFGATGVVRRCAEKRRERAEESFGRFRFQRLVRPRSDTLHTESIGLHTSRRGREPLRRCRKRRRRRKHGLGDGVLLQAEAVHQGPPCLGVLTRVSGYFRDRLFNVAIHADDVAVGECMRERNLRLDEFIPVEQTQFVRDRREVCQLIAAGVNVRPKARQSFFFGDRHPSDRVVLFEDKNLEPRPGEIAGTGQAVVSCADDDRVVVMRQAPAPSGSLLRVLAPRDGFKSRSQRHCTINCRSGLRYGAAPTTLRGSSAG